MASGKHEQEEHETRGDRYITQFGQGVERVLPKLINRQLNEPSMEARIRPRRDDSRDGRARKAEPS